MKKILLLFFLLIIGQQVLPHQYELKIYRKKVVSKFGLLASLSCGIVSSVGVGFTGLIIASEVSRKGLSNIDLKGISLFGIPSLVGTIGSCAALNSFCKWYRKRHQPILIFDGEGFTYEKPKGLFKERKYVRYLWKDVISHWSTAIVDYYGRELKKTWHYHIAGKKNIVKIDVSELDIPDKLKAKVESLRQGNIRALWA